MFVSQAFLLEIIIIVILFFLKVCNEAQVQVDCYKMDPVLVILTSLLAIAIAALVFLKLRHSPDPEERALREALGEADMQQDLAEGEEAAQDEENEGAAEKLKGMSRIERRKYEKQQAKDQRRREVDAAIEDRKNRRDAKERQEEEERIQQRETEKKEQEALEEMRKEKARKADEEYQKWVGHIAVESRGEVGSADEVEERLLKTISNAADEKKVVVLDTTARELSIGVEKLVSSIEKLIADGKLSWRF